ncbi:MAG: hypothetical protein CMB80_17645 [Flammeovirgaceae bacterium]|nr:hypothetical protein [Flammeovirgaceae bacterium]MBE63213.1 hypothetical protein [Flammeovirgaceae bacterium]|tara:strand:+ start:918 stop:1433 length:516 start_codon:yes stop_codon:yes gene_type:complete
MDELERFIQQNRQQFDADIPSDKVWKGVQHQSQKQDRWIGMWKVAAVLLLISTAYLIVDKRMTTADNNSVSMESDFKQVEQYYGQLIAQKKSEIAEYGQTELSTEFLVEIERLDQMYAQLKKTYKSQNSSEMVSDMMIKNLQMRIEILTRQVEILNGLKNQENESNEHIEI